MNLHKRSGLYKKQHDHVDATIQRLILRGKTASTVSAVALAKTSIVPPKCDGIETHFWLIPGDRNAQESFPVESAPRRIKRKLGSVGESENKTKALFLVDDLPFFVSNEAKRLALVTARQARARTTNPTTTLT